MCCMRRHTHKHAHKYTHNNNSHICNATVVTFWANRWAFIILKTLYTRGKSSATLTNRTSAVLSHSCDGQQVASADSHKATKHNRINRCESHFQPGQRRSAALSSIQLINKEAFHHHRLHRGDLSLLTAQQAPPTRANAHRRTWRKSAMKPNHQRSCRRGRNRLN